MEIESHTFSIRYSDHTLLAQRASYLAPLSSVFGPNSTVNYDYTKAPYHDCFMMIIVF